MYSGLNNAYAYVSSYAGVGNIYKVEGGNQFLKAISIYMFTASDNSEVSVYKVSGDSLTIMRNEATKAANKIASKTINLNAGMNYVEFDDPAVLEDGGFYACVAVNKTQEDGFLSAIEPRNQAIKYNSTSLYKVNSTVNAYRYVFASGNYYWYTSNYMPSVGLHTTMLPPTYKIVYDSNYDAGADVTKTYQRLTTDYIIDETTQIGTTISTSRNGYDYVGLSADSAATAGTYDENSKVYETAIEIFKTATSDTATLYAIWNPKEYTVKFDANDPDATGTMGDLTKVYDTDLTLPSNAFTLKVLLRRLHYMLYGKLYLQ